jgi:Pyridoxamine 5'-phosphate oxidase
VAGWATLRNAGLGIWHDESVWFSSSARSRKARNLRADPRCVVTSDNAIEPVVVEGVAEVVRELGAIQELVSRLNAKYSSDITVGFLNPEVNATFRVRPRWVFSLNDKEFTESPTRWVFEGHRLDGSGPGARFGPARRGRPPTGSGRAARARAPRRRPV